MCRIFYYKYKLNTEGYLELYNSPIGDRDTGEVIPLKEIEYFDYYYTRGEGNIREYMCFRLHFKSTNVLEFMTHIDTGTTLLDHLKSHVMWKYND